MQTLASRWITALPYKVFPFRPTHVCTHIAAQHFHDLHVNDLVAVNQVTSEWVMLPPNASYYLRMFRVTSEDIM